LVRKTRIEKPYSKGAKIFFADPAIYSVLEGETANFRETFVAFALKRAGEVFAEKDETKADLIFNNIRLEISGLNKKTERSGLRDT
jgi:predicted AAA+ superfamily ATPase